MIATTRCERDWPRTYTTFHQETQAPFRRADLVRVFRIGRRGFVIGRWSWVCEDFGGPEEAVETAMFRYVDWSQVREAVHQARSR